LVNVACMKWQQKCNNVANKDRKPAFDVHEAEVGVADFSLALFLVSSV